MINHKAVARIMRENGLQVRPLRRFVRTTDSDHEVRYFPIWPRPSSHGTQRVVGRRPDIRGDRGGLRLCGGDSRSLVPASGRLCDFATDRYASDVRGVAGGS